MIVVVGLDSRYRYRLTSEYNNRVKLITKGIISVVLLLLLGQTLVSMGLGQVSADTQYCGVQLRAVFLNHPYSTNIPARTIYKNNLYTFSFENCGGGGQFNIRIYGVREFPPTDHECNGASKCVSLGMVWDHAGNHPETYGGQSYTFDNTFDTRIYTGEELLSLLTPLELSSGDPIFAVAEGTKASEKPFQKNTSPLNVSYEVYEYGACGSEVPVGTKNCGASKGGLCCPDVCPVMEFSGKAFCSNNYYQFEENFCLKITDTDLKSRCQSCVGYWSAIGCIDSASVSSVIIALIRLGVGVAGGLALAFMIFASMTMSTSAGNPERLKSAQEMFTSAIVGLLVVLFSVIALEVLGVGILNLPGFLQ